jgi:hopanoid biosynthesis associated protein HpnK
VKRVIFCADDFGLDPAVNAAVEEAHRHGVLSTASLMVGAPAAADAVARARRLPNLHVGLHLVLVDGHALSPAVEMAGLVNGAGRFDPNMARAGVRFFFDPRSRRALAREIRAQFKAFHATGLRLDHVNAHKHFQLHPTVARLIVRIGAEFGMKAMRVPAEPATALRAAYPDERAPALLYRPWVERLRRHFRRAGLAVNDHVFGLRWSGNMDEKRLLRLLPFLPEGVSEIYFHPATRQTPALAAAMPGYRHADELAALLSPAVRRQVEMLGLTLTSYSDLPA